MVNRFIEGRTTSGHYDNHFSREQLAKLTKTTCYGALHSYGQNFVNKKDMTKYNNSEHRLLNFIKETKIWDGSLIFSDSGGFQASMGKIGPEKIDDFINGYYSFLNQANDLIDRAFILDLPPGPLCKLYKNWNDVYKLNERTYKMALDLPDDLRSKIIYIHHFRTPQTWKYFTKLMRSNDLFDKFQYHATGGIVANLSGDLTTPIALYSLPIVPLLNECKKCGRNYLNFHVLGGANYRDILFYELFTMHVKKHHNIDLTITYDSSAVFKRFMIGRILLVFEDEKVYKLDLRSSNMDKKFSMKKTTIQKLKEIVDEMSDVYDLKKINFPDTFYNEKTKTFQDDVKVYLMLYVFHAYAIMQTYLRKKALEIYPLYESGEHDLFNKEIIKIVKNLNGGKITKKQTTKSTIMVGSLDLLTNLDEDYCQHLVTKFLAKDEFSNLNNHKILTF